MPWQSSHVRSSALFRVADPDVNTFERCATPSISSKLMGSSIKIRLKSCSSAKIASHIGWSIKLGRGPYVPAWSFVGSSLSDIFEQLDADLDLDVETVSLSLRLKLLKALLNLPFSTGGLVLLLSTTSKLVECSSISESEMTMTFGSILAALFSLMLSFS